MFVETLRMHWRTLRWPLAILMILSFAAPGLWAIPEAAALGALPPDMAARYWMTGRMPNDGDILFPLLALVSGSLIALGVWYWDHRENHVLALSLPVSRPRYVLLKLATGTTLLALVAVAFFVGAVVASLGLDFPSWIHAHPVRLAFQFLLAGLVFYALIFALAAGTIPTAMTSLTIVAVVAVIIPVLPLFFGMSMGDLAYRASQLIGNILYQWPGPFAIFAGDWALIGV